MLWQSIANLTKYDYLKERFEIGYEFLRRNDLAELPEGLVELQQGVRVQIQHYIPAESGVILLRSGDFAVVSPEEAHRPRCQVGKESFVKKIVLKIPVS